MKATLRRIALISTGLLGSILFSASVQAVEKMPPFKIGLSSQSVVTGFELEPIDGDGSEILTYRPAESNYAGVILGYKWIGGTLSFSVPAAREVRAVEGESQYQDYRLSYYVRRFGGEIGFSKFKGYLIENSSELSSSTLNGETYYKLPDLKTMGYGANLFYVFSPETYSLPAAMDQSEIQETSAGSWLLMATWRRQTLENPSPLIPDEKRSFYATDQLFQAASANSYGFGGGYAYNWVPGSFFVSGLIALSLGHQQMRYEAGGESRALNSIQANAHARFALGWNARHFFLTAGGFMDRFGQETESMLIGQNIYGATAAIGTRF